MSDIVIRVDGLGKRYRIGGKQQGYKTFREAITRTLRAPFDRIAARRDNENNTFWALKDVSFEVKQGEVLGIIGRNGAGKSTLLKILSRITEPTEGAVYLKGRIGALLEVGTGFHPELTGRENIYLSGTILGMTRAEVTRKFDEIVDFAGVEQFIDTPVKRYSSGMGLRLGFAVAAHLEPEILVVDEVLAVGDAEFQKKCLGKMSDVAGQGRTVLFVSHNMEAIQTLCNRAILLKKGELACAGNPQTVINDYLNSDIRNNLSAQWDLNNAPGNENTKLFKASVKSLNANNQTGVFTVDDDLLLEFEFYNLLPGTSQLDVTAHLEDERGIHVFTTSTVFTESRSFEKGLITATCLIPKHLLNQGTYTINRLLLVKNRGFIIYENNNTIVFEVIMSGDGQLGWMGRKEGVIRPLLPWTLDQNLSIKPDLDLPTPSMGASH